MKLPFTCIFILFITLNVLAQQSEQSKIEHGVLLSTRIDSDNDFAFKVKGFGLEGGYYFLKKLGQNGMLSIECRLAYAQSERITKNLIDLREANNFPLGVGTTRTGIIDYKNLSVAIPIKYRHHFTSKTPLFALIGISPYFNLSNNTLWNYDQLEYDFDNNTILSEISDLQEDVEQSFLSHDIILAGFGYKKNRTMFDIYFSGGSTNFNNNFICGMDKLSIVLNVYYRLN